MKKSTLIQIVLGTVGGLITSIGMCMCLIEEWNMLKPGIVVGTIGILILICIYPIYRKDHSKKEKKEVNKGLVTTIIIGVIGSLILGTGMSLCLVNNQEIMKMILGLVIGVIGLLICVLNYPIYSYLRTVKKIEYLI